MTMLSSWRALFVREYLEHRISFQWVPLGITVLLGLAGLSALALDRVDMADKVPFLPALKIFEMGYLLLLALWMAYLAVSLFFFFGDAFHADRRNNAMLFWKSMPVSDLKILASKFAAGSVMFPVIVLVAAMISSAMLFLLINVAAFSVPSIQPIDPGAGVASFLELSWFGIAYYALGILWFAPFFAWVGALSTVFGRWSLPLAFLIPGLLSVIENVAFWRQGPNGGYVWQYLSSRWNFGLTEEHWTGVIANPGLFRAGRTLQDLVQTIDWTQMAVGIAFSIVVLWLASEYRRRRIA